MPSNHLILYCPLLLLPSILPSIRVHSKESALPNRWSKYWTFSFSICPSNEYSVPISFTIDWVDLLAVQGTLESLLHHYISEASIIWHSPFFIVQLSHPIMTPGKTMALTRWTFVDKIMSVLFNKCLSWSLSDLTFTFHFHALEKEMASYSSVLAWSIPGTGEPGGLRSMGTHRVRHDWSDSSSSSSSSKLVITFLPRKKGLSISWLQSTSAVIFEPKKIVCHCFHCFPIYLK